MRLYLYFIVRFIQNKLGSEFDPVNVEVQTSYNDSTHLNQLTQGRCVCFEVRQCMAQADKTR